MTYWINQSLSGCIYFTLILMLVGVAIVMTSLCTAAPFTEEKTEFHMAELYTKEECIPRYAKNIYHTGYVS
jgi:hypothetical protein